MYLISVPRIEVFWSDRIIWLCTCQYHTFSLTCGIYQTTGNSKLTLNKLTKLVSLRVKLSLLIISDICLHHIVADTRARQVVTFDSNFLEFIGTKERYIWHGIEG
jgi:hypothetical protein